MTETLRTWLCTCPYLQNMDAPEIDFVGVTPGNTGLYPIGLEERGRQEDVLGNVTVQYIQKFLVYLVTCPNPGEVEPGRQILEFQQWVGQQSARGLAPVFGDVPDGDKILAEKGKLVSVSKTGICKYQVQLTVQYVKKFERKE